MHSNHTQRPLSPCPLPTPGRRGERILRSEASLMESLNERRPLTPSLSPSHHSNCDVGMGRGWPIGRVRGMVKFMGRDKAGECARSADRRVRQSSRGARASLAALWLALLALGLVHRAIGQVAGTLDPNFLATLTSFPDVR